MPRQTPKTELADGTSVSKSDPAKAAAVLASAYLADDLAEQLTCREAEALAVLLAHHGQPEAARLWMRSHAAGDDHGDLHGDEADLEERFRILGLHATGTIVHPVDEHPVGSGGNRPADRAGNRAEEPG